MTSDEEAYERARDAYDDELRANEDEYHAATYPDGCEAMCCRCSDRLAERCDIHTHEWHPEPADGDSCYCGSAFYSRTASGGMRISWNTEE